MDYREHPDWVYRNEEEPWRRRFRREARAVQRLLLVIFLAAGGLALLAWCWR